MILSAFLIDLKCRSLQSGLTDLEKHKIFAFLLMVDFLRVFEITHLNCALLTAYLYVAIPLLLPHKKGTN